MLIQQRVTGLIEKQFNTDVQLLDAFHAHGGGGHFFRIEDRIGPEIAWDRGFNRVSAGGQQRDTIPGAIEEAGRKAVLVPGDVTDAAHCNAIVQRAVEAFGEINIVVNNAAYQMTRDSLDEIGDEEFDRTMKTNIYAMFYICKAAVPHMPPGGAIISTASINADSPKPKLIAYSATKAAIINFSGSLAALLAEKGIRSNCVAPGPIWTPLIPSTMPADQVEDFGSAVPMQRAGQPAELAAPYVMLASDEASYISGANIAVTGGVAVI